MKKRKGWVWTLGFTIAFALSTVGALTATNYNSFSVWPQPAALCAICAILTIILRSKAKKEEAQWQAAKEQEREAKRIAEEQREIEQAKFRYEYFPVAGVTFQNEDKTDRQKILKEIALNQSGYCDVWFEQNEELGDESGISVMTEFGCVGFIRRSEKQKIRRFFDKPVQAMSLSVERFTNDDGQSIYRADVQIVMKRGEPGQEWYFDDLQ